MLDGLKQADNGGFQHDADPGEPIIHTKRWSITTEEGELLKKYCLNKSVLEIGTGLGVSSIAIGAVAKVLCTVDIDPWVHETIVPYLKTHSVAPISCLKEWPREDVVFDVIFIDGCHQSEAVEKDIQFALKRLAPGGTILFHDTLAVMGSIKKLLGESIPYHKTHNELGVYPKEHFLD